MLKTSWISLFLLGTLMVAGQDLKVENLRCEYKNNPIGIDVKIPRLSWQLVTEQQQTIQKAYEVRVAASVEDLKTGSNLNWASGKINTAQSVLLPYKGTPLTARQRCYWQVKVWDNHDNESEWSEPAFWEMGLLKATQWTAKWIEREAKVAKPTGNPVSLFRTTFNNTKPIKKARAYITAQGLYEAELNGQKIGDQLFTPGWTPYHKRLQYQTYDITTLLKEGKNALGIRLGEGWYKGDITRKNGEFVYGGRLAILCQVEIEYTDGAKQVIVSDENWRTTTGAILMSDIYKGEVYDRTKLKEGWTTAAYKDKNWKKVKVANYDKKRLVAPLGVPVRKIKELKPVSIFTTDKGEKVVDMGQNMVGWIRLKVKGNYEQKVTLLHAEVLDKDGNFYRDNLRKAAQKIEYTLSGEGEEVYEPTFTFQGFRYVQVINFPSELTLDNLTGIVIHSDLEETGNFNCSHKGLNQLQKNIQWSQRGNFLDIPMNCPQRDERLGWTGDAQVFAATAAYNQNVAPFFTRWLQDLAAEQLEDGSVPWVVPNVLGKKSYNSAGWADAVVIVPWQMYLAYNDKRILENQYQSMQKWVRYMEGQAHNFLWKKGFHFGDWLYYNEAQKLTKKPAYTDTDFLATCFFAHSTKILEKTATILNKTADALRYKAQFNKIKTAFQAEFLSENGRLSPNTQTAYTLALAFNLLPKNLEKQATQRLVNNIKSRDIHLSTGLLGTPYLCDVLTKHSHLDLAYQLLLQKTYPSWLYPISKGATTIWERQDGIQPNGDYQSADRNSFNHYAYGAIGNWIYRTIGGINFDSATPGYKHIVIQPQTNNALNYVNSSLKSLYGEIQSNWVKNEDFFELNIKIPPNTLASVYLPNIDVSTITSSAKVLNAQQKGNTVVAKVGSGTYNFTYRMKSADKIIATQVDPKQYSLNSKLGELWKNPNTKAVLLKHLPALQHIPTAQLEAGFNFPLKEIAPMLPNMFTADKMGIIDRELRRME